MPESRTTMDVNITGLTQDITAPESVVVEIQSRPTGPVLYVHVNGISVLRICRMSDFKMEINEELINVSQAFL